MGKPQRDMPAPRSRELLDRRTPQVEWSDFTKGATTTRKLVQLQRTLGNRYVQRALSLALAGNAAGHMQVEPEVERVIDQERGSGHPLDTRVRRHMEGFFGADFSGVRVHTGARAHELNRSMSARAFTTGPDIFFQEHAYNPGSASGRELLAHELTHVVQQSGTVVQGKLTVGEPGDKFEQEADQAAGAIMRQSVSEEASDPTAQTPREPLHIHGNGAAGAGIVQREEVSMTKRDAPNAKSWSGAPAHCGPDFCRPFIAEGMAIDDRRRMWPVFALGIGVSVHSRVVPLWSEWAHGGSGVKDLTNDFGGDFFSSPTTAVTTSFLIDQLKAKLKTSPPSVPAAGAIKLDLRTLIPDAVKAIDDPASSTPPQMNFDVIRDIPGNLAGGIGKDQKANPIGAKPSPQDDERIVKGEVTVVDAGADLLVIPNLSYTVKDTIDLCPGDCGAKKEQIATIPMSAWEATGISGDVPFTVDFGAPPPNGIPFKVPKPPAPAPVVPKP